VFGQILIRTGKKHDSITLEADGQHLMSDVWTSVGVVIGVTAAVLTGLTWLDPIIALVVGLKIGWEGIRIFRRSTMGLMDSAIAPQERDQIETILNRYQLEGIQWHAMRTRQAGARRFISVHILMPGTWTVQRAHNLSERLEAEIREVVPYVSIFTHIEPDDDPAALNDLALDRDASTEW
jgi:cation diffusion facilitator family transporter